MHHRALRSFAALLLGAAVLGCAVDPPASRAQVDATALSFEALSAIPGDARVVGFASDGRVVVVDPSSLANAVEVGDGATTRHAIATDGSHLAWSGADARVHVVDLTSMGIRTIDDVDLSGYRRWWLAPSGDTVLGRVDRQRVELVGLDADADATPVSLDGAPVVGSGGVFVGNGRVAHRDADGGFAIAAVADAESRALDPRIPAGESVVARLSPNGRWLVAGGAGVFHLWDLEAEVYRGRHEGDAFLVTSPTDGFDDPRFAADASWIASRRGATIVLVDVDDGAAVGSFDVGLAPRVRLNDGRGDAPLAAVAGSDLVVMNGDGAVSRHVLFDPDDVDAMDAPTSDFAPGGGRVVVRSDALELFGTDDGRRIGTIPVDDGLAAFSPFGRWIVVSGQGGDRALWRIDADAGPERVGTGVGQVVYGPADEIALALDPEGRIVVHR